MLIFKRTQNLKLTQLEIGCRFELFLLYVPNRFDQNDLDHSIDYYFLLKNLTRLI